MNQSEFKANTRHRRQARENACEQVTIGFGLTCYWLRKCRELCQPIQERSRVKAKLFSTQMKTAQNLFNFLQIFCKTLTVGMNEKMRQQSKREMFVYGFRGGFPEKRSEALKKLQIECVILKGWCQILKNNNSKNSMCHFEEIRRKLVHSVYELIGLARSCTLLEPGRSCSCMSGVKSVQQ